MPSCPAASAGPRAWMPVPCHPGTNSKAPILHTLQKPALQMPARPQASPHLSHQKHSSGFPTAPHLHLSCGIQHFLNLYYGRLSLWLLSPIDCEFAENRIHFCSPHSILRLIGNARKGTLTDDWVRKVFCKTNNEGNLV